MMVRSNSLIILAVAIALSISGCDSASPVLATVNDNAITQAQFDAYVKLKRLPVKNEKRRDAILDNYLEREAMANLIANSDLLEKELINAELNEFRKEMLISRYFEKFLKENVNEQAVQNYYANHAEDFQHRKVHVAHILVRSAPNLSETERQARLTTAQEAYSKLMTGKDFEQVAKDYSEDKVSAKKGGDLGWLKEGAIDPLFSSTVFGLEKGKFSEPFETPFGFHIVKVVEEPTIVKRPFEAVKGDIRYQIRNKAKNAELDRLITQATITKK